VELPGYSKTEALFETNLMHDEYYLFSFGKILWPFVKINYETN